MVVDQIPISEYSQRTEAMKQHVISTPHEICLERALLITESYKQTKGEDPILRFAKAIEHLLTNMTIKIWDDEIIVGNRCTKYSGAPLFPEIRIDTLELDCESYNKRLFQHLYISEDETRILKEQIIPYWREEGVTVRKRFEDLLDPEVKQVMDTLVFIVIS